MKKQLLLLLLTATSIPCIIEEIQEKKEVKEAEETLKPSTQVEVMRVKCPRCR